MSSLVKHKSYWWAKKDPLNYCVVTLWKLLRRVRLLAAPWTIQSVESSSRNTGVGSLSLLQGIFPTQELSWSLLHCRWILYQLSHQGSPKAQSGYFSNVQILEALI